MTVSSHPISGAGSTCNLKPWDQIENQTGRGSDDGVLTALDVPEIKYQVLAKIALDSKELAVIACLSKTWHAISANPYISQLQLESVTALTYSEIQRWQKIFQNRYQTAISISELIRKCPILTKLNFSNALFNDSELQLILEQIFVSNSSSLKYINLINCPNLTMANFQGLSFIKKIYLKDCKKLASWKFDKLASLEELDIDRTGHPSVYKFPSLPVLKMVKIANCDLKLSANFKNLGALEVLEFNQTAFIQFKIHGLKSLKKLYFTNCRSMHNFKIIEKLPRLDEISFQGCDDLKYFHLKWQPALKIANFDDCIQLRKVKLSQLPNLVGLSFARCNKLQSVEFKELHSLEYIVLDSCEYLIRPNFENLVNLKQISLNFCSALEHPNFKGLISLKTISLKYCFSLADACFEGLSNLEKLHLQGCAFLKQIKFDRFPALRELNLNNCKSLANLQLHDLDALEELKLNNCSALTDLDLSPLTSLKRLSVKRCPQLDVAALLVQYPNLEIIH